MNDEQLDKLFKDTFQQQETTPDTDTWHHIAAALDNERKVIPLWKKSWVRYAAAIAVVLSAGLWAIQPNPEAADQPQPQQLAATPEASVAAKPSADEAGSVQNSSKGDIATATEQAIKPAKEQRTVLLVTAQPSTAEARSNSAAVAPTENVPARHSVPSLPEVQLAKLQANEQRYSNEKLQTQQVVEIDPIQPLIDNPEEEETMLAARPASGVGLVPGLLNKISEVVNPDDNKTIHFSNDEEGSLRIDIFNSLVKNRNRKRK